MSKPKRESPTSDDPLGPIYELERLIVQGHDQKIAHHHGPVGEELKRGRPAVQQLAATVRERLIAEHRERSAQP